MPKFNDTKRKQILNEILSYGDDNTIIKTSTIARKYDVTTKTITNYKKMLIDEGLLVSQSNLPEYLNTRDAFSKIPSIQTFKENLILNELSPVKDVTKLYKICSVISKHPDEFLKDIRTAQLLFLEFQEKYNKYNPEVSMGNYRKTLRKFLTTNNIVIPTTAKVLSNSSEVTNNYGKIALDDDEYRQGLRFMEKHGGKEFRALFAIHHEIFPRSDTIINWIPQFSYLNTTVNGKDYEFLECSVYENKQKKTDDKLVLRPEVIEICKNLDQNTPIISSGKPAKVKEAYAMLLRMLYEDLGKIEAKKIYSKGTDEWFYSNRPLYALRHSSAVMWMRRTGFNATLVATMGWEDPDTLTNYYARMSVRNLMQQGTCFFCNPPSNLSTNEIFCSPTHCIAYYGRDVENSES